MTAIPFSAVTEPIKRSGRRIRGRGPEDDPAMPIQINCPSCRGAVRVPEELLGKRVQCPRCQVTFVAEVEDEPPAVAPTTAERPDEAAGPVPQRPRRPAGVDEYDDYDYYDDRPRRLRPRCLGLA